MSRGVNYRDNLYAFDYSQIDPFSSEIARRKIALSINALEAAIQGDSSEEVMSAFEILVEAVSDEEYRFKDFEKDFVERVYQLTAKCCDKNLSGTTAIISEKMAEHSSSENIKYIDLSKAIKQSDLEKIKVYIELINANDLTVEARDHFAYMIYTANQQAVVDLSQLEDEDLTKSYVKYVVEYLNRTSHELSIRSIARDVVSEAKDGLNEKLKSLDDRISEEISQLNLDYSESIDALNKSIQSADDEIKKEVKDQSKNNIQLLGLFTAVLAFIIVNVQVFTSYTFVGALLLSVALGFVLISFVLAIEIILDKKQWELKYKSMLLIILLATILILPFLAQKYYSTVPKEIFIREETMQDN